MTYTDTRVRRARVALARELSEYRIRAENYGCAVGIGDTKATRHALADAVDHQRSEVAKALDAFEAAVRAEYRGHPPRPEVVTR